MPTALLHAAVVVAPNCDVHCAPSARLRCPPVAACPAVACLAFALAADDLNSVDPADAARVGAAGASEVAASAGPPPELPYAASSQRSHGPLFIICSSLFSFLFVYLHRTFLPFPFYVLLFFINCFAVLLTYKLYNLFTEHVFKEMKHTQIV